MTLYYVSAIVTSGEEKPWLLSVYDGELSLDRAMKTVGVIKKNHTTLSVWVDEFKDNKKKTTVFHECYLDITGQVKY